MGLSRIVRRVADPMGIVGTASDVLKGGGVQGSSAGGLLESMAADFYRQTSPVRNGLIDRSNRFIAGNLDVTQSPMFGAIKAANEQQFKLARDNALAMIPSGGRLTSSLVNLEGQKARAMTEDMGNLAQDELNRAMTFSNPQIAMSGLGTAGQLQNQTAIAQSQQRSALKQGLGSGVGAIFGSK